MYQKVENICHSKFFQQTITNFLYIIIINKFHMCGKVSASIQEVYQKVTNILPLLDL